ncbi:hypothetical protein [Ferrovibrio terrae]|uniref:hypothetical protein n=1 Tax=Ferrovibrio terrae TaxID=2594003 RepID=UPI0031377ED2
MNSTAPLFYGHETSEAVSETTLVHFRPGLFGTVEWPERYAAPLNARPERIVIICENKLISLDMILPVAFELKAEHPDITIEFLFLRRDHMAKVKENYILWAGMQAIGTIRFLSYGGHEVSNLLQRGLNLLQVAKEILTARKHRTLLFYRKDFSRWPVGLIAMAVRAGGGALIGFPGIAYPMSIPLLRSLLAQEKSTIHHRFQADRQLIFHPLQRQEQRRVTNAPMAVIGTSRWFPHWQDFLEKILTRVGILDIEQRPISVADKPNILMFYPGNLELPDLDGPTACRDQMIRSLQSIRRVAPQARVLLKPHVICDIAELKRELSAFSDLDIRLTYAHPLALAKYACVCTVPNGTSVIDDMYVSGLPLIDSALYLPEIRNAGGSLFPNHGRISCVDDATLDAAFKIAVTNPADLPKPERGHLFWPKASSLAALLWKA